MVKKNGVSAKVKYSLDKKGCFIVDDYNKSKPFSNFFPGIAGLWGIPMWAFYINRGQCLTSFGIESKDKAIMEFQPANKSYRLTSLQGFRTFIKIKKGKKSVYWEPFQNSLTGTEYDKRQRLIMQAHDLTLEETNHDLGLKVKVNYFTLPEEPYSALVRQVTVENVGDKVCDFEIIDGLPLMVPYGLGEWAIKNMSRTVEAWVRVRNVEEKAPYYHLNVEIADTPEVKHIKQGNFFFSMDADTNELLEPIVEASCVFGQAYDFIAPQNFIDHEFVVPEEQQTSNRTPSAMSHTKMVLKTKQKKSIISLFGYSHEESQLNEIVDEVTNTPNFIAQKAKRNEEIIEDIRSYALTKSSSSAFDLYSSHTFLDNVLRGGLPVSLKTKEGNVAFSVYSRKHGDLERDYNYFTVAPTFYSQGNGNYRDVNQNRRNDVWFNKDVKENNILTFMNLIQADGYNPLVVCGTAFTAIDKEEIAKVLEESVDADYIPSLEEFVSKPFLPGALLEYIELNEIPLQLDKKDFLGRVLNVCRKEEMANHGEGFWVDHWTYTLDLVESYLALYPENLQELLIDRKDCSFYHNSHYVLPRDQRYILTDNGVRQYKSVHNGADEIKAEENGSILKKLNGEGGIYFTNILSKLLCLIANKAASLDPSGIGIEMEADKPGWYDALNGLPGLLGSSVCETIELKRFSLFLLESLKKLSLSDDMNIPIFEELATFFTGLGNVISHEADAHSYWAKSNLIKEHYRNRIRLGIEGEELDVSVGEIKHFLNLVIQKTNKAIESAKDKGGFLRTYFAHNVVEHEFLDRGKNENMPFVKPLKFGKYSLPLFLEGYVHYLRAEEKDEEIKAIYEKVIESDLYDKKLKMYKVNASLDEESHEIGRTRVFPSGWLENESVWLHMEYKFILELLKKGLHEEFYDNFKNVMIPFLSPKTYGRSILENSSFIVSSAHDDEDLHGQGFVARLSGSTAEFVHIWLLMNVGLNPFSVDAKKELVLAFEPVLAEWLFTKKASTLKYANGQGNIIDADIPINAYAFKFLNSTLVVYHNKSRKNTFGKGKAVIKEIAISYPDKKKPIVIKSNMIQEPYSKDIRDGLVDRIDIVLK